MKKILAYAFAAAMVFSVCAEEDGETSEENPLDIVIENETPRKNVGLWPAFFAIGELPSPSLAPDVVGLRLTIPFSTVHENVTGIDIGFWGRAQYFEGLMCSILRNDVKDELSGIQVGIYNTAHQADMFGAQIGLWNEAGSIRGIQAGLVNTAGEASGLQIGVINRAEEMYGFQVGLINVIRDAELQFFPFVNIGF